MNRTITPFRITLILDGEKSAVAQAEHMERITDDDGAFIHARALPAEALDFPLSETFLGEAMAKALGDISKLEADAKIAKDELDTETKAKDDAIKERDALDASNNNAMAMLATRTLALESAQTELAETKAAFAQLEAFRQGMIAKVSTALQSGDPEQFAALAVEFLTPEEEKARQAKVEKLAALKAEAAELEASLKA